MLVVDKVGTIYDVEVTPGAGKAFNTLTSTMYQIAKFNIDNKTNYVTMEFYNPDNKTEILEPVEGAIFQMENLAQFDPKVEETLWDE